MMMIVDEMGTDGSSICGSSICGLLTKMKLMEYGWMMANKTVCDYNAYKWGSLSMIMALKWLNFWKTILV